MIPARLARFIAWFIVGFIAGYGLLTLIVNGLLGLTIWMVAVCLFRSFVIADLDRKGFQGF